MKTTHLTIASIALMMAVMLILSSCEKEPVIPEDLTSFSGTWGVSDSKNPSATGQYSEYIRFVEDNGFEYFAMADPAYAYYRGGHVINGKTVSLIYKGMREFVVADGIARYTQDYFDPESTDMSKLTIVELGTDRMIMKGSSGKYYFHRVAELKGWNTEFSAPEVPITEDNLTATWDQLDFYINSQTGTSWWYFYEPDKNGITLLPDSIVGECPFWRNRVLENQVNADILKETELIDVDPLDCAWGLSGDTVTLTCAKYIAYTPDDNDTPTAVHEVTPEEPIAIPFIVQVLTKDYLILYNTQTQVFHAFHKSEFRSQNSVFRNMKSEIRYEKPYSPQPSTSIALDGLHLVPIR